MALERYEVEVLDNHPTPDMIDAQIEYNSFWAAKQSDAEKILSNIWNDRYSMKEAGRYRAELRGPDGLLMTIDPQSDEEEDENHACC